jgi:hypothetical protein
MIGLAPTSQKAGMDHMIEGKDKEETIELTMKGLGISRLEAEFRWALNQGEIEGDVIVVKPGEEPETDEE